MAPKNKATRTSARIAIKSGAAKVAISKAKTGKSKKTLKGPSGPKASTKKASVAHGPTAATALQSVGVHEDSSSDEEGQVVPFRPHNLLFTIESSQ